MYYTPEICSACADGVEMKYFKFGKGEKAFVMLPGLSLKAVSESAQSVASAYRRFGEEYTVYVFERKENIEAGYSIDDMTSDTAKVMKKIGIADAYVFGVSQGGMIGICLAADYPELVKKLFLASTSAKETENSKSIFVEWVTLALKGKVAELAGSFTDKLYTEDFLKKYREFLIKMHEGTPHNELVRFCILSAACDGFDLTEKLKKIKCPTAVTGAEEDKVFSVDDFRLIAEAVGAEMYIYKNYCHAVYDEAPDFKDRIAAFFAD